MNERAYREAKLKEQAECNMADVPCAPQSAGLTGASFGPVSWRQGAIVEKFSYHSPSPEQQARMNLVREAGKMLAMTLQANVPAGGDLENAIAQVHVATMIANAAIIAG